MLAFTGILGYSIQAIALYRRGCLKMLCLPVSLRFYAFTYKRRVRDLFGRSSFLYSNRFHFYTAVSLTWLLGLVIGIAGAWYILDTVQYSAIAPASFIGLMISSFIPVFLVCLFSIWKNDFLLLLVVFVKAMIHGYCLISTLYLFENGFFFYVSFMFSQCCCSLLMLAACFCLRHSYLNRRVYANAFCLAAFILCLLDYFITF